MKTSKFLLSAILVAMVVFLSTCKKEEINTTGDISGIVTESIGDQPVSGAIVSLSPDNQTQTTGADGKYVFNKLTPKEYTVQVSKEGYQPTQRTVTVKPGQVAPANFALEPLPPVLWVSLTALDFGASQNSLPVEIKNTGKGTLTWQVVEDVSWISVNPTSGSTTNQTSAITVTVSREGLAQGTHSQVISVTSNGGSATIVVQMSVSGSVLNVTPLQLDFGTAETEKIVYVNNTGTGTATYTTTPSSSWVSTSPNSGSITNQTIPVTITVNRAGLNPNTHTGTVIFNSNNNSVTVNLSMVVEAPSTPTLNCGQPGSITHASAEVPGSILNIGTSSVIQHGHCWSTSPNPTTADTKSALGSATSAISFSSTLNDLAPNTTYYVRAYATNSVGTGYSTQVSFTTNALTSPTVTSGQVGSITQNSAQAPGNVTSVGTFAVTQHGHCWSTSQNPTTGDSKSELGSTSIPNSFSSNLSGLTPNTSYYVRAYATNSVGTSYSAQVSFTTNALSAPSVTSGQAVSITHQSALLPGSITSLGTDAATQHGHCWSTSPNPTTADQNTQLGSATSPISFNSSLTGLSPSTTYYVRAYATNSVGTGYSSQVSFTTLPTPTLPEVSIGSTSNLTHNSATISATLTNLGDGNVTQRGHCWNTTGAPTTSDSKTTLGSTTTTGTFSSNLTGLTPSTTYYVRAYATNSLGTSYSEVLVVGTNSPPPPSVTTSSISSITTTSASGGGNVTNDNGSTVTSRGVCWSTSPDPTLENSHTSNGSGTGSFTSNITGLLPGTTYYVRAYATNIYSTGYGNQITFTTTAIQVGDSYGGGKVAYIFQPGDPGYVAGEMHGIIAATSDQTGEWGCIYSEIYGADDASIGSGKQNTLDIVAGCPTLNIAAKTCNNLVLNNFEDWYLPSQNELFILYYNRNAIGNFTTNNYWSSTEINANSAFLLSFYYGSQNSSFDSWKDRNYHKIRCIRYF